MSAFRRPPTRLRRYGEVSPKLEKLRAKAEIDDTLCRMSSVAPLSAAQLHEPILPLAQPPLLVLQPELTIAAALDIIRRGGVSSTIHYFYVVGEDNTLVGVVPTRQLLTAQPDHTVREVMLEDVVAIPDWATVLIASEYFATRRLLAFPVVNDRGQLLGVVDVSLFTDEVIELARQTYDDIFQLIGVHGTAQRSTWSAFRDRFPWLLCNIAGGLIAAFIASRFEHLLREVVVLALFIPIVLALGESVSMQALTLTLQSLTDALSLIYPHDPAQYEPPKPLNGQKRAALQYFFDGVRKLARGRSWRVAMIIHPDESEFYANVARRAASFADLDPRRADALKICHEYGFFLRRHQPPYLSARA